MRKQPAMKDFHLSVHNNSDNSAVLLDLVELLLNHLLTSIISPLSARFCESLLLGLGPE
jgi:hypothetical protein